MPHIRITTDRLELIAATEDLVRAEIEDRAKLACLLDANVPTAWPPQYNELQTMNYTLERLEGQCENIGWWNWYFLLRDDLRGTYTLVGNGGFKGRPDENGMVEMGYSVLDAFQNCGYGSEAVQALMTWAFSHPEVTSVSAETLPELIASQRVLEKNGFACVGEGSEPGVIRFVRSRSQHRMVPISIEPNS